MKLHINGEEREFANSPAPFALSALVEMLGMKADRVAIELNRDIVPRDRWAETTLNEGDKLEMVHFVGGGVNFGGDNEEALASVAGQPDPVRTSPRNSLSH
jgi:sulfur carrier protein